MCFSFLSDAALGQSLVNGFWWYSYLWEPIDSYLSGMSVSLCWCLTQCRIILVTASSCCASSLNVPVSGLLDSTFPSLPHPPATCLVLPCFAPTFAWSTPNLPYFLLLPGTYSSLIAGAHYDFWWLTRLVCCKYHGSFLFLTLWTLCSSCQIKCQCGEAKLYPEVQCY